MKWQLVMPLALASLLHDANGITMAPLHSLSQHDQNGVHDDLFGDMIPLALASSDVDGVFTGIITFFRSR